MDQKPRDLVLQHLQPLNNDLMILKRKINMLDKDIKLANRKVLENHSRELVFLCNNIVNDGKEFERLYVELKK